MESLDKAIAFLRELDRAELAALVRFSKYRFVKVELWEDYAVSSLEIYSPPIFAEALSGLPEDDRKRIGEAIVATAGHGSARLDLMRFGSLTDAHIDSAAQLLPEVLIQRNEMIAVATTTNRRIADANDYYRARQRRITTALKTLGVDNPNPHDDLWDWYHKWKADFPSYAERRHYVNEMYQPLIDRLVEAPPPPVPPREPTGWERVDRTVEKAHARLAAARDAEDFQAVGLLCREIIISVGQSVYDPWLHDSPDGTIPSETDGGRMIEAFIASTLTGDSNENIRRHARASLRLAVELQHKRGADFRAAALCLEATSSVVNLLAILCGRRDP